MDLVHSYMEGDAQLVDFTLALDSYMYYELVHASVHTLGNLRTCIQCDTVGDNNE